MRTYDPYQLAQLSSPVLIERLTYVQDRLERLASIGASTDLRRDLWADEEAFEEEIQRRERDDDEDT